MNQPLLSFLATKNYKNLRLDDPIYLNNLNIFIGSNGSGKSNFISCLKFLKDCLTAIADENRGVSSFEDAVSKMGGNRILDSHVKSPAKVSFCYGFSQISPTDNAQRDNAILDLKIYTEKQKAKASISEEYLYGGEDLYNERNRQPFFYYKPRFSKGLHTPELITQINCLELARKCPLFRELYNYLYNLCQTL